jgi:phosphopantetheinyl transferase
MPDVRVIRVVPEAGGHDVSCLSDDERAKAATFRRPDDARAWAVTRAALRIALSTSVDLLPAAIDFATAERGRLVMGEGMPSGVVFNVAHTRGLALVAVSTTAAAIGVDVEAIEPLTDVMLVARRVLRPGACTAIAHARPDAREARFFREWTRHEARLKCRGTGLVEPHEDDGRVDDLTIVDLPLDLGHAGALAVAERDATYELVDHVAATRAEVA